MNGKAWTAIPVPVGLLLAALTAPCAFAAAADAPRAAGDGTPPYAAAGAPQAAAGGDEKKSPETSPGVRVLGESEPATGSFCPDPSYAEPYDAAAQLDIYSGKHLDRTANPPIQEGIRLYDRGAYEPRPTWLGAKNPIGFHFMAYGDLRSAVADNDNGKPAANGKTEQSQAAARLNLDFDMAFTATERIHAFMRPFDQGGFFTRYDISGGVKDKLVEEFNTKLVTLFFEGDLGNMLAGWRGEPSSFDLPISGGLIPIATQNGIWIQDAFKGFAIGITAKNSARLDISNFNLTFFTGLDRVTTAAVPDGKAKVYGLAGFADVHHGYLEAGYGYVDADVSGLGYHNVTAAFSQRIGSWLSNSVRLIGNFGQTAPVKTADGLLILVENSLITHRPVGPQDIPFPLRLVPYLNLFAGVNTPQSLARAGDAGGVLVNTGINFQSDGVTLYPTLDATARKSYGGALGVEYLFNQFERQLVVEAAGVGRTGNNPLGSQVALGISFQQPLTNAWVLRFDTMRGWLEGQKDIFGVRMEIRRKF